MNAKTPIRRDNKSSEDGYILVAVMFMLAILVIAMSVAAPRIAKEIQRDREVETMHRGKQYSRAVKLYYKKFNAYPANQDALVKTNEIRFLRRKYLDPMTGKDDWKPIALGQNKAPTAMGFFGVPLNGGGVGGGLCGNALPSSTSPGASSTSLSAFSSGISGSSFSSGGSFGAGSGIGSGSSFGSSSPTAGCPSTAQGGGAGTTAATTTTDTNAATGSSDPNTPTATSPSTGDSSSGSNSPSGIGAGTGTANNGSALGTGSGTGTGLTGQTFGGAGIIGFSPGSPKPSILVYKKKTHYNEWEFVYDPIAEQIMMQGGNTGTIGTPAGSMPGSSPIGGSSSIGGSTFGGTTTGGSGSGTTSGTGSGGSSGSNPPSPQPQQ
jgi:type II secretory pathway pseudopilin PulG